MAGYIILESGWKIWTYSMFYKSVQKSTQAKPELKASNN